MAGPPNQPPGPDDETVIRDEWGPEDETGVQRVEEAEEPPGPRPPKFWPWLLALVVLVLGGLGALWYFTQDDEDDAATATVTQTVSVPAQTTTGTTTEAATTGQTTTSETTTGETTTTAPPPPATVPNVVGRPLADAAREFGDQNLIVEAVYGSADEVAGTVVAQAQPPGTELSPGDAVQLDISDGINPSTFTSVPDVVGLERNDARERLDAEGFEVLALEVDEGAEGDVVFQTPEAGAGIPGGSLVLLYVGA